MAKYALVIGITQYDYPYNFQSLTKPAKDAEAVARLLEDRGGFQKVTRLPEGWNYERNCPEVAADRVTSEQFVQALQTFLEEAGRGDALIYFSGHGFVVADKLNQRQNRKKGYLVTSDSQMETIAVHGIPFDSLNDFFHNSNLNSLVLLLDCCHAGSYLERDLVEQTLTAFGSQKDYYLIAACRATEKAYEGEPEQENSVFTAALLEGLAPERTDKDGQISCDRLFDYVYKNQKLKYFGQQPIRLGLGGSITLVTYPIENQEPAKLNRQNPYQGLRAFELEQAQYFYGRDRVIRELLVRLNKDRFLSVIGPSGSGKSSLVKAGLLPQLKSNRIAESSQWEIESFTPGRHPLTHLQEIFARQHRRNQPYVLFIDQFEEVFTLCDNEEERQTFMRLITDEATNTERLARVIWAMRGDFLDRCAAYPEPATLINSTEPRTYIVPPFSLQELEEAIKKPAERHGVTFEEGLIAQILEDVEGEPGALPLLQYALSQLWRVCVEYSASEQPQLTQKGYKEIGGVKGALNETANNLYHTRLPEDQDFIRDLFMQLVQVEEDKVMRRPISWERLDAIAKSPEQAQRVVGLLANQRLLVTDEKNVQVVHEALLSEWVLLRKWIEDNREDIRLSRRLEAYCREWQETFNQAENALLPDAWLAPIEDWVKRTQHQLKLTPLEAEYLQRSIEKRDREVQAELEQERELREAAEGKAIAEIEKALEAEARAKAEAQRTVIAVRAGMALAMLAVVAIALALWAQVERKNAQQNAIKALTESAVTFFSTNYQLEALVASAKALGQLKGMEKEVPPALQKTISGVRERNRLDGHTQEVMDVSFSPDGEIIASASMDGTIKIWDTNSKLLTELKHQPEKGLEAISFSPNSQLIASSSDNNQGIVRLWNIKSRSNRELKPQALKTESYVRQVSFSLDGQMIASANWDNTVRIWRVADDKLLYNLPAHSDAVLGVAFSPDGQMIATTSRDKTIKIWRIADEKLLLLHTFIGHTAAIYEAKFSPNGQMIASASIDKTIKIWRVADGKLLRTLYGHGSDVNGVKFSPDGQMIVSASKDTTVKLWRVADGRLLQTFVGHKESVNNVSFSPDGQIIASASDDDTIRFWSIKPVSNSYTEVDNLLIRSCIWLDNYLKNNSKISSVDRSICRK